MVTVVVAGLQVVSKPLLGQGKLPCQKIPFLFRTTMFQEHSKQKLIGITKYSLGYVQLSRKSNLKDKFKKLELKKRKNNSLKF